MDLLSTSLTLWRAFGNLVPTARASPSVKFGLTLYQSCACTPYTSSNTAATAAWLSKVIAIKKGSNYNQLQKNLATHVSLTAGAGQNYIREELHRAPHIVLTTSVAAVVVKITAAKVDIALVVADGVVVLLRA